MLGWRLGLVLAELMEGKCSTELYPALPSYHIIRNILVNTRLIEIATHNAPSLGSQSIMESEM